MEQKSPAEDLAPAAAARAETTRKDDALMDEKAIQAVDQPPEVPPRRRLSECVQIDDAADVITIHGFRYSGSLFEAMAFGATGQTFAVVSRADGVITLENRGN